MTRGKDISGQASVFAEIEITQIEIQFGGQDRARLRLNCLMLFMQFY